MFFFLFFFKGALPKEFANIVFFFLGFLNVFLFFSKGAFPKESLNVVVWCLMLSYHQDEGSARRSFLASIFMPQNMHKKKL